MSEKLNMQELISLLAEKSGINKKDAEIFLREYFNQITEALLEDKIAKVKKIGTFKLSLVLDRESVDVNNGTRVLIPAHNKVSYTPDSQLAKKINEPFALFEPVEVEENASDNEVKPYPETEEEEFIVARSEEDHIKINDIAGEAQETIVEIEEQEIVEEQTPEIVSETGETQNKSQFDNTPIFKDPGRRTSYKWFWTIPVLIVFSLIGLFLLCIEKDTNNWTDLFFTEGPKTDLISLPKENNYISGSTLSRKEILTETTITDSSFPSRKDTVIPKAAITEEIPSSSILSYHPPLQPASGMVPGKVKKRIVAPGERLTLISQEEYGHKSFWVYLYEENKELIKDPNNVMAGTNIVIPEPSKYGIDKENEESVHRAEKLAEKYKK